MVALHAETGPETRQSGPVRQGCCFADSIFAKASNWSCADSPSGAQLSNLCFWMILMAASNQSATRAETLAKPVETIVHAPGPAGALCGLMLAPAAAHAPVVLIIPGSGPTDRDGNNSFGIRAATYRLLAEALAAKGIGSVRIDKRGMFASHYAVADGNAVTIADYAADVHAWCATIRQLTGTPCIWLLGHSEGALVALVAARDARDICGVVLAAAPGRPVGTILRAQLAANPANAPLLGQAFAAIDALESGRPFDTTGMDPSLMPLFRPQVQDFLIDAFSYDPAREIAGLSKPVLILQGQRDVQIGEADAQRLKDANPNAKLVLLPDANHHLKSVLLDDSASNRASYADSVPPLAPDVADSIVDFINGRKP